MAVAIMVMRVRRRESSVVRVNIEISSGRHTKNEFFRRS